MTRDQRKMKVETRTGFDFASSKSSLIHDHHETFSLSNNSSYRHWSLLEGGWEMRKGEGFSCPHVTFAHHGTSLVSWWEGRTDANELDTYKRAHSVLPTKYPTFRDTWGRETFEWGSEEGKEDDNEISDRKRRKVSEEGFEGEGVPRKDNEELVAMDEWMIRGRVDHEMVFPLSYSLSLFLQEILLPYWPNVAGHIN